MRSLVCCVVILSACGGGGDSSPVDAPNRPIDAAIDAAIDTPPDPCAGVTCECTVATQNADCGAHEFCNATSTSRTCECVAGYSSSVNGCAFTGTIADPGFGTTTAWQTVGGATLNPAAAGGLEAGEAQFTPASLCALAHVKQTTTMPAFAKAQPLVLVLSYKDPIDFNTFDRALMGVSFGGANWTSLPNFGDAAFHTARMCLPEGAFAPASTLGAGAPVTFAFGPYLEPDRCPTSSIANFAVDHVEIVAANANECGTAFGQSANFNAEGAGGWTFVTSGTSSGGFTPGLGVNGSKAARLTLGQRCDSARMDTTLNVPNVANPALDMFVGTTAGANATMTFGGGLISMNLFDAIPLMTQTTTLHMCLPPALRGQSLSMGFSLNGGSGLCSSVLNHQVFADNVTVVDDPSCASSAAMTNPGFEHVGRVFGSSGSVGTSTAAALVHATGEAHAGTQHLALEAYGRCAPATYTILPIVPAPNGAAGPALKFFAKVGTNPDASTSVAIRGGASQALTEGGGYLPYTVCLKPIYAGRTLPVVINHNGGSGLCDNSNYTPQFALIDDIEVTTDAACPAQ